MFSQRHWPNCWCVARRPRREFATNSRIFWRKICAIAALNARFFRCATRRRRALELRRRLASFKSESSQKSRKVCCAVRRNGENFAANSCVIDANFGKILRMFDRWLRAFSALHAPENRRSNSETSPCFRSDTGRIVGALRVDRAENLQRIRAFSGGKIAQWRRRTHGFFGAQHGADLHWSRRRLAIFKSE